MSMVSIWRTDKLNCAKLVHQEVWNQNQDTQAKWCLGKRENSSKLKLWRKRRYWRKMVVREASLTVRCPTEVSVRIQKILPSSRKVSDHFWGVISISIKIVFKRLLLGLYGLCSWAKWSKAILWSRMICWTKVVKAAFVMVSIGNAGKRVHQS